MSTQQRVIIGVEIAPQNTAGAFDPIKGQVKTLGEAIDQIGSRLKKAVDPLAKADPLGEATRRISAPTAGGVNVLGGAVEKLQGRFNSLTASASKFGDQLGKVSGGIFQLIRGTTLLSGSKTGLEEVLRTFMYFDAIAGAGRGIASIGRGFMGSGSPAAAQAAGGGLGPVGTTAAIAAAPTATTAATTGGSWAMSAAAPLAVAGLALHSVATLGSQRYTDWQVQNTGDVPGVNWLLGTSNIPGSNAAVERQRALNRRQRMMADQFGFRGEALEEARARELQLRQPFDDLARAGQNQLGGMRASAEGMAKANRISLIDQRTDQSRAQLQYTMERSRSTTATAAERAAGDMARQQFLATFQHSPGASAEAAAGAATATANRQRLDDQVRRQQAQVNELAANPGSMFADRQHAEQEMLRLQTERAAAVQQEVQAQRNLAQSEVARLQNQQQMARLQHEQARARADAFRDETRSGNRSLAGMSEEDRQRAVRISRQLQSGQQLAQEDISFAQGIGVFQPRVNEMLDRRAGMSPEIQEIMAAVGRPAEQANLDRQTEELRQIDINLQQRIEVRMDSAVTEFREQIETAAATSINAVAEAAGRALRAEFESVAIQALIRGFQQQQGAGQAAATGGAP